MNRRFLLLACALLLSGCPRPQMTPSPVAPPPLPPPSKEAPSVEMETLQGEVKELSRQAELLLREQDELVWKAWVDGAAVDIAKTYQGREALFTLASIKKIERLRLLTNEPREVRVLNHLHTHFVGEYLASALAEPAEAIANLEASMTFTVEGKEYAYRDLERLLANEKSTARRHALYEAATPLVQRLSQSLRRKEEKITAVLQELGYPSYEAYGAELRMVRLDRAETLADQLLQATQTPYTQVMSQLADKELGLPWSKVRRSDLPRLFRPRNVDKFFPKDALLTRAQATLAGLGIELPKLGNYKLDSRELPTKNPRPLTLAVEVPNDIRTSIKPGAGVRDQAMLLHELGHALLYVHAKETRFELSKLGGGAVPEAFGFLLEDLVEDPLWLEEHAQLSGEKQQSYLSATAAHRLYLVRRAAGQVLYELKLRKGEGEPKALYSAIMARTYGIPMTPDDEERFLVEQEDFFQSADNVQAWFLAAQLQSQLKTRFGVAWWRNPQAGEFLRFLWAKGNSLTAREVARMSGDEGLKTDPFIARLSHTLKVPIPLPAAMPRIIAPAGDEPATTRTDTEPPSSSKAPAPRVEPASGSTPANVAPSSDKPAPRSGEPDTRRAPPPAKKTVASAAPSRSKVAKVEPVRKKKAKADRGKSNSPAHSRAKKSSAARRR
ncbi:MAG TPA: chromosome segregation protein SMC [Myxococcaceae bacterium]|nr:chromosome segregation protein SMC [Myxococcaceae bacterium]